MYYDSNTYTALLKALKAVIDDELDKEAGNYIHDSLAPVALKLEEAYVEMDKILMFFFLQDVYGEDVDKKGAEHGVSRKAASCAAGKVRVRGSPGGYIQKNKTVNRIYKNTLLEFIFIDENENAAELVLDESGEAISMIKCLTAGSIGNVPPGNFDIDILGVSISNNETLPGGVDTEEDEPYIERILDRIRNPPSSGNKRDYERWAKEVAGVGYSKCVPLWRGNGTVKVIIADGDGMPVDDIIVRRAQEYLDPVPAMGEGESPVGAEVTVVSASSFFIDITIKGLMLESGFGMLETQNNIREVLAVYMRKIPIGGIIKRQFLEAAIVKAEGVMDFEDTLLNGVQKNLKLQPEQKPILGVVSYD